MNRNEDEDEIDVVGNGDGGVNFLRDREKDEKDDEKDDMNLSYLGVNVDSGEGGMLEPLDDGLGHGLGDDLGDDLDLDLSMSLEKPQEPKLDACTLVKRVAEHAARRACTEADELNIQHFTIPDQDHDSANTSTSTNHEDQAYLTLPDMHDSRSSSSVTPYTPAVTSYAPYASYTASPYSMYPSFSPFCSSYASYMGSLGSYSSGSGTSQSASSSYPLIGRDDTTPMLSLPPLPCLPSSPLSSLSSSSDADRRRMVQSLQPVAPHSYSYSYGGGSSSSYPLSLAKMKEPKRPRSTKPKSRGEWKPTSGQQKPGKCDACGGTDATGGTKTRIGWIKIGGVLNGPKMVIERDTGRATRKEFTVCAPCASSHKFVAVRNEYGILEPWIYTPSGKMATRFGKACLNALAAKNGMNGASPNAHIIGKKRMKEIKGAESKSVGGMKSVTVCGGERVARSMSMMSAKMNATANSGTTGSGKSVTVCGGERVASGMSMISPSVSVSATAKMNASVGAVKSVKGVTVCCGGGTVASGENSVTAVMKEKEIRGSGNGSDPTIGKAKEVNLVNLNVKNLNVAVGVAGVGGGVHDKRASVSVTDEIRRSTDERLAKYEAKKRHRKEQEEARRHTRHKPNRQEPLLENEIAVEPSRRSPRLIKNATNSVTSGNNNTVTITTNHYYSCPVPTMSKKQKKNESGQDESVKSVPSVKDAEMKETEDMKEMHRKIGLRNVRRKDKDNDEKEEEVKVPGSGSGEKVKEVQETVVEDDGVENVDDGEKVEEVRETRKENTKDGKRKQESVKGMKRVTGVKDVKEVKEVKEVEDQEVQAADRENNAAAMRTMRTRSMSSYRSRRTTFTNVTETAELSECGGGDGNGNWKCKTRAQVNVQKTKTLQAQMFNAQKVFDDLVLREQKIMDNANLLNAQLAQPIQEADTSVQDLAHLALSGLQVCFQQSAKTLYRNFAIRTLLDGRAHEEGSLQYRHDVILRLLVQMFATTVPMIAENIALHSPDEIDRCLQRLRVQ